MNSAIINRIVNWFRFNLDIIAQYVIFPGLHRLFSLPSWTNTTRLKFPNSLQFIFNNFSLMSLRIFLDILRNPEIFRIQTYPSKSQKFPKIVIRQIPIPSPKRANKCFCSPLGQLISECPFGFKTSSKKTTKFLP